MSRCALFLLLLAAQAAQAQGDGARNYQLVPDGTRSVTAFGIYSRGNQSADPSTVIQGAKVDAYLAVLQYTQAFALAGNQAQAFAMLPFGEVKGSAGAASTHSSGLGDASVGVLLGLIGSPALPARAYAEYQPGFTVGALGKIFVPTGEYDSQKAINLGANRWALQLGAPIVQYLGKSFVDPSLTSFELTPSITFFTNNNDPRVGSTSQQDPLAKFEAHVTRNIGASFWVSADAFYARGGETITDKIRDDNAQRWLGLGASAGAALSDTVSAMLTYGKVVKRNDGGLDFHAVRADVVFAF